MIDEPPFSVRCEPRDGGAVVVVAGEVDMSTSPALREQLRAPEAQADIVVLDLREVAGYTDFFVVVSGTSDRQAKAIHDGIHLGLKKHEGMLPRRDLDPVDLLEELPEAERVAG